MTEKMTPQAVYALRLGDDALILAQRLGEWCGRAPALEIDLSLANFALDLLGQATYFLELAGEFEGKGRNGDTLAFRRDALDFTNCLIVEQENGDFARTIVRQFLFSTYQELLYAELARSHEARFAQISAKALKEVTYHARLAGDWVVRLGDGTDESRSRTIGALDWMWRFVDELFEMDVLEQQLASDGIGVNRAALRTPWDGRVARVLKDATLELPTERRGIFGGRRGHHSAHLGHLLSEMQFLQRTYPGVTW